LSHGSTRRRCVSSGR